MLTHQTPYTVLPVTAAETFEVVDSRVPVGLGLYLRARSNGRLFRVMLTRDPSQPRFWCLRIDTCTASGVVPTGARSCLATVGTEREGAISTLEAIRADAAAWFAEDERQSLRGWLDERATEPLADLLAIQHAQPRQAD
ncbi:MAG: hypothetical protein QOF01_366 [Thermomicrobiales bacterium]|jgi:hypothetical protein|nr:hypothetical protein [Thermomicrobiales bacterium]MEA2529884.1 hypothetical protein [Thermomicrobiales bacterium]MEA2593897.1 hypothetical protein [Thermomicrobiales bacterium]